MYTSALRNILVEMANNIKVQADYVRVFSYLHKPLDSTSFCRERMHTVRLGKR